MRLCQPARLLALAPAPLFYLSTAMGLLRLAVTAFAAAPQLHGGLAVVSKLKLATLRRPAADVIRVRGGGGQCRPFASGVTSTSSLASAPSDSDSDLDASVGCLPSVRATFDAGNIVCKGRALGPGGAVTFRLAIRPDPFTEGTDRTAHAQWFYFRADGVQGRPCIFEIEDLERCSYAGGFDNFKTVASHDRQSWWRVASTTMVEGKGGTTHDDNDDADADGTTPARGEGGTTDDDGTTPALSLRWSLTPERDSIYFAYVHLSYYFPPPASVNMASPSGRPV